MKPYGPPRPIRSQGVPTPRGPLLTDARIFRHVLAGYYGEDAKVRAIEELDLKERIARPKTSSVSLALAALL